MLRRFFLLFQKRQDMLPIRRQLRCLHSASILFSESKFRYGNILQHVFQVCIPKCQLHPLHFSDLNLKIIFRCKYISIWQSVRGKDPVISRFQRQLHHLISEIFGFQLQCDIFSGFQFCDAPVLEIFPLCILTCLQKDR